MAEAWGHASARAHAWRGLAVYGADGTTVRVPDSAENRAHFGGQDTRWNSTSGYPLVRLVTLMALRSHILAGARFGAYALSEGALADELWPLLPEHSLTIFVLPERRERSYPRAVKIKMSNYARKRPAKPSSRSRAK